MSVAPHPFQVFVKPVGAQCNLACRYCYYFPTAALYPEGEALMADDLLEAYIAQQLAAVPTGAVLFAWHGGEPTIAGLDWYRKVVALQRRHRAPGQRVLNGIQTNGLLLDDAWCRFLKAEGFSVGLSIDGPAPLHDAYRQTRAGQPTHARVLRAMRLLQRYGVPFDTLTVVHAGNVHEPEAVYRFLVDAGADYLQFLPLVARGPDGAVTADTPSAEDYGAFLCHVFDLWWSRDVRRVGIQLFEEALRPLVGREHALCHYRPTCGDFLVLEHSGDVYSCDHFVDDGHRLGNLRERSLVELAASAPQQAFGQAKAECLPQCCRQCAYLTQCHGGCPKDRILCTAEGEPGLNYLCTGLRAFWAHVEPVLARLVATSHSPQPIERVIDLLPPPGSKRPGRNDLCPCGSGIKFKDCCLGKPPYV
ncbi:MAG: anaerobic sulfatase maturase [Anaerolineales bacterium]